MKKRLGDYIQEYSVRNKSGEDIPVYSITNSQGFCRDYFSKEVASKDKTTYKIVPRGCFAYNPSRINVGSVDWQRDEERVIVSPLYNVFSVSPEVDQQYLYYYLKSSATLYRIKEVATGSVRDNLRLSMLYDFMIELPSLDVQRQIVSNLDLLASIIRQRNQQLTKLDELIKARFVEMFGDPIQNEKCWETKSLFDLGYCKNGMNFHKGDHGVEIHCLGVGDFKDRSTIHEVENLPFVALNESPDPDYLLQDGDIVFVRSNGNKELVGRCLAIYPANVPVTYSGFCIRYRLTSEEASVAYLLRVLKADSVRKKTAGRGANIQNLNQQTLSQLAIPLPPLSLQNQFAAFVAEVDKSKLFVGSAVAHKPFDIEFFSKSTVQRPIKEV